MGRLEIKLLGPFQASLDGVTLSGFDSDKVRALLAYLAVEAHQPHRRERLAGLLWPDWPERSARTNLRSALANLRKVIADHDAQPPFLRITRQTIQFNHASDAWLDVLEFKSTLQAHAGRAPRVEQWERAIRLYRGSFLEGFSITDSLAFDEWALVNREALQIQFSQVLQRLGGYYEGVGAYDQALRRARQLVALDPYLEGAHRQVMRLLTRCGQRNEALAQYELCRQILAGDLGVEPQAETEQLYQLIKANQELPELDAEPAAQPFSSQEFQPRLLPITQLPTGTITFLFADIQGSTKLLSQLRDRYADLLADQRQIMRKTFSAWYGQEVDAQGDACLAAFPRASDAVSAAVEIQRAFFEHQWPGEIDVCVRLGLHTGEPLKTEEGYVGMDVHRAARIAHAGHGGQVLLSETTATLVCNELPEGVNLLELGHHLLKDMHSAECIRQLVIDGLPNEFPPLESLGTLPPGAYIEPFSIRAPAFLEQELELAPASVFVGRELELAELERTLGGALISQGGIVFITGGPGRGKTSLLKEFTRRSMASHPDLLAASGNCNSFSDLGDPFLPFREIFGLLAGDIEARWVTGDISNDQARRLWDSTHSVVNALLSYGPNLIETLINGPDLLARAIATTPGNPAWLQQLKGSVSPRRAGFEKLEGRQLYEQVTNVLHTISRERPLLLVLDDLQWADAASIGLLFHLGRRLKGTRIMLGCIYRPEEVAIVRDGAQHPLEKVLSEFKRHLGDIWIDLGNVSESEDRLFVEAYLNTEPNRLNRNFRDTLFHHTGGHPLFTVELLRDMQDRGDLILNDTGYWIEGPALNWRRIPARVEGVIEARINRLDEVLREILKIASIEGESFTAQVVARLSDISESQLWRGLSHELEYRHRIVREQSEILVGSQSISRYSFSHNLIQQYLYALLSHGERRLLHKQVAVALEDLYQEHLDLILVQLAHHYSQAQDRDKALEYILEAGDHAKNHGSYEDARRFYDRAMAMIHNDQVLLLWRILSGRIEVLGILGESQARHDDILRLLDIAQGLGDEDALAQAYYQQGTYLEEMGDYQAAISVYEQALEAARQAGNHKVEACTLSLMALCLGRVGDQGAGAILADRAFTIIQSELDDETRARVITNVAAFYNSIGDLSEAAQLANQQVTITNALGHRLGEMIGLLNLGYQYVLLGLFEMGKSSLEHAFRLSQTIGAVNQSAYCKLNLGLVYTRLGDFKDAQKVLDDSISVLLETGDSFGQAAGYAYLALAFESSGDLENAARYFSQSQQLYASIGSAGCEIDALAGLARCNLALEDLTEAKRNVTEIWNFLDAKGPLCLEFPVMTYLSCVYVFDALGDASTSLAAIQAGYDDLIQRAGKISDLIWRESFLNNIPEHREITRLWEKRVGNKSPSSI